MKQASVHALLLALRQAGTRGLTRRELAGNLRPEQRTGLADALKRLVKQNKLLQTGDRFFDVESLPTQVGEVVSRHKGFGFVRLDDQSQLFVPGHALLEAMPGDRVRLLILEEDRPEGRILQILQYGSPYFTGTLIREEDRYLVRPDGGIRFDLPVDRQALRQAAVGDKVYCQLLSREGRDRQLRVRVLQSFGSGNDAANCAEALLVGSGVPTEFSPDVLSLAEKIACESVSAEGRFDLRDLQIFTIDGADTKDIDDALSLEVTPDGYLLGVHIADVSHYVQPGSPLDRAAFNRGTSLYFADRVIPMLPPALSNGICSLNENEDRLAFSCLMAVSKDGRLVDYRFAKSCIRSRKQCVYSEVNRLLAGDRDFPGAESYTPLLDILNALAALTEQLIARRRERGAPELETVESALVTDENGKIVDVQARKRGFSERIIEECMLLANQSAAMAARKADIPFIYRVHESPEPDRVSYLREVLSALGLPTAELKDNFPAQQAAALLNSVADKPIAPLVHQTVLRTFAKAKYFEKPLGHYGLALADYAQFTSPIRRYPDLFIHRVLSRLVTGVPAAELKKQFAVLATDAARQSTLTEQTAVELERSCEDCYKAAFMQTKVGAVFSGIITGAAEYALFVMLPNGIDGRIPVEDLPEDDYSFDGVLTLTGKNTGRRYRIGDPVQVVCSSADVASGTVYFSVDKGAALNGWV